MPDPFARFHFLWVGIERSRHRFQSRDALPNNADRFEHLADAHHDLVIDVAVTFQDHIPVDQVVRGVRMITAVYQATVPWCSIILRRVFGVAGAAHGHWITCS